MDRFANITLTFLICSVALGQFVQVITRYVLEIPVMGLEESLRAEARRLRCHHRRTER